MALGWGSTAAALLLLRLALAFVARNEISQQGAARGGLWLAIGVLFQLPLMIAAATVSGLLGRDVLIAHIVGVLMVYSALVVWGLSRR